MRRLECELNKNKILLYSLILSLIFSCNNLANAQDVMVSSGKELKSVIQKASEPTNIQFKNNIDISGWNVIPLGSNAIEIDGEGKSLINEKDSRFTFVKDSSLALKNIKYEGKNAAITIYSGANPTILLDNVSISGRTTSSVSDGAVLHLDNCDATLNNVSISSSRVNILKKITGGIVNINAAQSKGIITDLIDNQITSSEYITGGLIYNRRTLNPDGELNLSGNLNQNEVIATNYISGGILNNEGSNIHSINWNDVKQNNINSQKIITGGFIQNKLGTIDELRINSFSDNTITSGSKIDGGLLYNDNGIINGTLEIGQITKNIINATTDYNGLITDVAGTINAISIDSISGNEFNANYIRGGIINLQGANITGDITINTINDNIVKGGTVTGFVLYLRESTKDATIPSKIGNINVKQIKDNRIEATNITSLLLRSALVPQIGKTVISQNGNITVDEISNNKLIATDCNENARGGIIYNFLHSGGKTTNTTVSLGDINFKQVSNNRLESITSSTTFEGTKAVKDRHVSGVIIANSIQSCYGNAIIKSIDGEYVGNALVSKSKMMDASGGVISNSTDGLGNTFVGIGYTLDENNNIIAVENAILGTYKNNYVQSEELAASGGVIANYIESSIENDKAQIGNIKANFSGNYVVSNKDSAYGGAIANFYTKKDKDSQNAIINSINSTFENNFAQTKSANSSKGAYGGAIVNTATIKAINNSIFKNNYALSNNGSNAFGGAIYTRQDLIINAYENGISEFTNNYVSKDGGVTKNYEAINIGASDKTLTLNATTYGTILLNDYINGKNGYNVALTGDSTGTIKLFNNADIKGGANVTVGDNIVIDTADGVAQKFSEFNSLNSSASAKYNIDIDLSNKSDDKLNYTVGEVADGFTTKTASGGLITLDSLNFADNSLEDVLNKNLKIQIIKNNDKTDNLQLALSDKLIPYTSNVGIISQIIKKTQNFAPTINYKDLFGEITNTKDIYGLLGLDKTNTTNDSLNIKITQISSNAVSSISDALAGLTNIELKDANGNILDKTFNLFDEDSFGNKTPANYKVSDNLGSTYKNLNIVGATKNDSQGKLTLSELDLNNKTSFEVNAGSTLNFSDIKLKGNKTLITNNSGNVNFINYNYIDGKISGTTAINTGTLEIDADNLDVVLTNNGALNLESGVISKEITGSGTTNIIGSVTNNATISQDINVNSTGDFTVGANINNLVNNGTTSANADYLTGTINNSGTLNLLGTLDKTITGVGTTKINGTLNLSQASKIEGILDLNNGTISTNDSNYSKYDIATINGTGKATIDVDWTNLKADTFNSTSGNGVLNLKINETSTENIWDLKTIQITNGGVEIAFDTMSGSKDKVTLGSDELKANTDWSDKIGSWKKTDTYSEKTFAVKTEGSLVNNAIRYEVIKTNEGSKLYTTDSDTLALIIQNTIAGTKDKTFTTSKADDVYIVKENLGILADNLTISGAQDGTNISTIILGDKQGVTISDANSLTIKDVKIASNSSIIDALHSESQVILDNSILQGDVLNNGSLTVKNTTSVSNITGVGTTCIEKNANFSVSKLIQNELTNAGNLIVDNLQILTSANNSGTITNNSATSSIKNLTNTGNINGNGNLELSGTSINSNNISQKNIKISGTLDNTSGTIIATDTIENTGSITTQANKLIATNGIINNNSLSLTNGVLSTQISGNGTTNIVGTVTNNAIISQDIKVDSTGNFIVGANISNLVNNGTTSANISYLTGAINNIGTLNLSGTLNKTIAGNGITKIFGDNLTLVDGAIIKGSLDINNQTLNVYATNTDNIFNNVNMNSGTLNLINNNINNLSANSFNINGNVNLLLDADLMNATMDRLPSTTVANGIITVNGINLLSDSKNDKVYIPFAYDNFKDNVQTGINAVGKDADNKFQTTSFSPIFKYDVSYNPSNGYFLFSRGATGGSSSNFNPAVLSASVNSQIGAYSAINESFNYAFRHADYSFMPLPNKVRALANKYAIIEPKLTQYENEYAKMSGIWYQPYAIFENVGLSNGPRVDIQSYGSLIGGDSEYQPLKRGWGTVITPYIGYNGSSQSYSGVSTTTNGGILGLTQTFYRGNFYTALTINAGASNGESHTMYGRENYTALMTGIASKTGYNFEFNNGKFIIQPSMLMAYTFVRTFDYTNASGVKISSEPLNSIQLHPTIKFMGNIKNGWQPYASVGMVWNILNETKFTANDVRLPEMSIKPYVEYGVGLQKNWQDKCSGFIQAMLRNGGRNGIALTFGFKWALGRERKPIERVQSDNKLVKSIDMPSINNTAQKLAQLQCNASSLNDKLNILTTEQIVQRANMTQMTISKVCKK